MNNIIFEVPILSKLPVVEKYWILTA